MMELTVRLFGPMRRAVDRTELTVAVAELPVTCAALRRRLTEIEPRLADLLPGCRFAVNCQFAEESRTLCPTDEISLLGFVSGG